MSGHGSILLIAAKIFFATLPTAPLVVEPEADQELKFKISADSEARITFRGEVTFEAIDKLIKLLELSKDTFPSRKDIEAARPVESKPQTEPQQKRLDETVEGGRYRNEQGDLVDANGNPVGE